MNTREYLMQLRNIDSEIAMSISEAQSWRELALKLHHEPSDIRVDTSPAPDKMESLVVKAADCALKAEKEHEKLIRVKTIIEDQIKSIDNQDMKFMLWLYYHDKCSHKEVARRMNYSFDYEKHQMNSAIKIFEGKYGHEYIHKAPYSTK